MRNKFIVDESSQTVRVLLGISGREAIIDLVDLHVAQSCPIAWTCHKSGPDLFYARYLGADKKPVYLHRLLCAADIVDHANGNTLDDRRSNLRPSDKSRNGLNRTKPHKRSESGFRGVTFIGKNKKYPYRARVFVEGKRRSLGNFATEAEAAAVVESIVSELISKS